MEQGNHQSGQPPDDEEHEQPSGRDQQPWRGQDEGEPSTSGATDMDADMASLDPAKVQRLLRKAETVLSMRTDRILLVLERPFLTENYLGCLRTAECLGVHNVWIVVQQGGGRHAPPEPVPGTKSELREFRRRVRLSRNSSQWLDVQEFGTTAECVAALVADGRQIWATDLGEGSVDITAASSAAALVPLPARLAIVMGREADGCTSEMLAAAARRVHLPLVGFNASLNLTVATGMVLQQLLSMCPEARGDMSQARKAAIRRDWYGKLARHEEHRAAFLAFVDTPPPPYADLRHME